MRIRAFDLFCGAGGSSCGAKLAGATIVGGIDAWKTATDTFQLNHPRARTWTALLEDLDGREITDAAGRIDLLLASPECTNHTFAKGNRREGTAQEQSRATAFQVIRFAKLLEPRWIVVENVVSMRKWKSYRQWKEALDELGYCTQEAVLNAQDFGVPQSRRRLFVLCDRKGHPAAPQGNGSKPPTVRQILHSDQSNGFSYRMTPLFRESPKRAEDTLARARRAMAELGDDKPFLIVYYGTDAAGGWQTLDRPLRTITTLDRFALVRPRKNGHEMRMLQPPELAAAMGFPADYSWPDVTRRERIKLVGNAVAPPVMKAIVECLTRSQPGSGAGRQKPLFAKHIDD